MTYLASPNCVLRQAFSLVSHLIMKYILLPSYCFSYLLIFFLLHGPKMDEVPYLGFTSWRVFPTTEAWEVGRRTGRNWILCGFYNRYHLHKADFIFIKKMFTLLTSLKIYRDWEGPALRKCQKPYICGRWRRQMPGRESIHLKSWFPSGICTFYYISYMWLVRMLIKRTFVPLQMAL